MRTKILIAVIAGALTMTGVGYVIHVRTAHGSSTVASAAPSAATARVVRTDLSDYWTESGTIGYRRQRTLRGVEPGVLTWLPPSGSTITRGGTLYRVGDRPVTLFYGSSPMFRDIDQVGMVGRDVRTLADNLRALGYQIGHQPAPGTRVTVQGCPAPAGGGPGAGRSGAATTPDTPAAPCASSYQTTLTGQDAIVTQSLRDAVKRWQKARGVRPATGTVMLGDILVLPGAVRVGAASARLGDDATGNLMAISDQAKAVSVEIDAGRADDLRTGQKVQITLPDSSTTAGTIGSVSSTVRGDRPDGADPGSNDPKVQVVVAVDRASAIRNISSADVTVRFTGTTAHNVLAVPVGALLALEGGGYGVQIVDGALTAVKVGLFADGMVQITGTGITAGTRVVTTS